MTTFFGILTKIGEAKEARAKALALPVVITEMEVGDGGSDSPPLPDREQTTVIGAKRRAPINRSFPDTNNASWVVFEQVIPEQVGGWWIRQLGLRDADGDLIAVANCPPTYKPQLAEGSARTQVVRFVLQVSSAKDFELKVDPSVVLATRQYVDDGLLQKLDKNGTAVAAVKLATARSIALTGDGSASVSFDGTKNVSGSFTLAPSGVSAGAYGNASTIATFEVDAKGRLIAAGSVAVGNAATATKLATGRSFSITGGATAAAVNFDGSGNVILNVTALDVSKATLGTLPVARGGTGVNTVPAGSYLTGNGTNALAAKTPAQVLEDIAALPKSGGSMSGPILLGTGATIGSQYGANTTSAQVAHVVLPDGGGYSVHLASVVGAMKITLPQVTVGKNNMVRMRVEVYEYRDTTPLTILISGYAQSTRAWSRCGATIIGGSPDNDLPIRFGSDADGRVCVWLGDLGTNWSYPSIVVSEVLAKYNTPGASVDAWGTGWSVGPVTAFETVAVTLAGDSLAFARSDLAHVAGLQDALNLKANTAVQIVAGNGLTGGGTFAASRTITLGTPGRLSATSTNAVSSTSHTHEIDTQATSNDTTPGRILTTGNAFGIGADNPLGAADLDTVLAPGKYGQSQNANATTARHYPVNKAGSLDVGMGGPQITTHVYVAYDTGETYTRSRYNEVWSEWAYHPGVARFPKASESVVGIAPIATQAEVDAGGNDTKIVTAKKLRWGISMSIGANGHLALPSWLGGLIIQWGSGSVALDTPSGQYYTGVATSTLSIPFPKSIFAIIPSIQNTPNSLDTISVAGTSLSSISVIGATTDNGYQVPKYWYLAIGN